MGAFDCGDEPTGHAVGCLEVHEPITKQNCAAIAPLAKFVDRWIEESRV